MSSDDNNISLSVTTTAAPAFSGISPHGHAANQHTTTTGGADVLRHAAFEIIKSISNDDGDVIDSLNEALSQEQKHLASSSEKQDEKYFSDDIISNNNNQHSPSSGVDAIEKHQLEIHVHDDDDVIVDDQQVTSTGSPNINININETVSTSMLSPRQGVSFREEFARLPDFTQPKHVGRSVSPALPHGYRISQGVTTPLLTLTNAAEEHRETAPFFNVTLSEFVGKDVPLLIGELPVSEPDYATFWSAVNRLNICGVVTVNLLHDDKGTESNTVTGGSLPWPINPGIEAVYARKICARTVQIESFRSFQSSIVRIQDLDYGYDREICTWSFTSWPTSGHNVVPPLPHCYLDFLRAVIQQTYFSCRTGQPLLIVDRNGLDIAGLTAAVMMLLYQACGQRRADVWRCVADLRTACRRNVVSRFAMYEFLYDCLLQVMCATPTIMAGNFRRAFRHLLRRGPPLIGSPRLDPSLPARRIAPIIEQFELVCTLSGMYRSRAVSNKHTRFAPDSPQSASSGGGGGGKRNQFEPRHYKEIRYFNLPSFLHAKHFLAVRGVIHVNLLLELMAKRYSRTLLWFSETPRADEILTGNQHDGVFIGDVSAYGVFYSYELEAPTSRGPWRITVVQFVGWPAFCGERPARPCRELILTLRRVCEHADAVAASFTPALPQSEPPLKPVITMYEAEAGCCTWRSAMAALACMLDQRMSRFLEVDIFRTAQMFKMFEPETILISPKQYTWCFKMAWASYLLSNGKARTMEAEQGALSAKNNSTNNVSRLINSSRADEELGDYSLAEVDPPNNNNNNLNSYDSEKYLYSYPAMVMPNELVVAEEAPVIVQVQPSSNINISNEAGERQKKHAGKQHHRHIRNQRNNVLKVSS